jgi:DNA-binding Xre family transcriptional regulator
MRLLAYWQGSHTPYLRGETDPTHVIRLRIEELLRERHLTPYFLAKMSRGRISLSTAYRLIRLRGALKSFDAKVLDALCDVLKVQPSELFVREAAKRSGRA